MLLSAPCIASSIMRHPAFAQPFPAAHHYPMVLACAPGRSSLLQLGLRSSPASVTSHLSGRTQTPSLPGSPGPRSKWQPGRPMPGQPDPVPRAPTSLLSPLQRIYCTGSRATVQASGPASTPPVSRPSIAWSTALCKTLHFSVRLLPATWLTAPTSMQLVWLRRLLQPRRWRALPPTCPPGRRATA